MSQSELQVTRCDKCGVLVCRSDETDEEHLPHHWVKMWHRMLGNDFCGEWCARSYYEDKLREAVEYKDDKLKVVA
jgi:hypothetical protein